MHRECFIQTRLVMSSSKTLLAICVIFILALQPGCSDDKLTHLRTCYGEMRTVSEEFVEELSSVNDEVSAKAALPRLESTCQKMFATGRELDEAAKTTLRSAAGLKEEIAAYRTAQKIKVDEELRRIGKHPKAVAILEPFLTEKGLF